MGTFYEVLPGNLVFFHFCYIGMQEIELLDHTTELYRKNYISTENFVNDVVFNAEFDGVVHVLDFFCANIIKMKKN